MKTITSLPVQLWWMAVSSFTFVPAAFAGGVMDFLLPRHELQAITVTDVTPAGLQQRQASPAAPLYYVAVSAGYREFGAPIAGERMISRQLANDTMLKTLAKRGYLPAATNQRPDLVLVWTWGTFNAERPFATFDGYSPHISDRRILRFLGGDKLGLTSKYADPFPELGLSPGLLYLGGNARNFMDASSDDYFVATAVEHSYQLPVARFLVARSVSRHARYRRPLYWSRNHETGLGPGHGAVQAGDQARRPASSPVSGKQ
jgi:hypothetical protein